MFIGEKRPAAARPFGVIQSMIATDSYFYHYFFIGIFVLFAAAFPFIPLGLAYFLIPKKPSPTKSTTYECGLEARGDAWIRFRAPYYIFALIFVIFDIETVFIYPWAVAFKRLGLYAFAEMVLFLAILSTGLIYSWKKKVLEWE